MNPNIEKLEDKESNAKLDQLIDDIAEYYIGNVGWCDVLEVLPTLEQAESRHVNFKDFNGMEWIAAHLLSVLRDKVGEQALDDGKCPNDGRELESREEPQTRDYPGREWLECPLCHEEFNVR
jgi:hypothetical protein